MKFKSKPNRSQVLCVEATAKNVIANLRARSHVDDQNVKNIIEDEGPGNIQINNSVDQNQVLVLQHIPQDK